MSYLPPFYAVNSNCTRVDGALSAVVIDKIRINHYWTRDEDHLINKKIPRRVGLGDLAKNIMEKVKNYDMVSDRVIMRFVPKLRKRLEINKSTRTNT